MKVFKYDLHYYGVPEVIQLPFSATIVSIGVQDGLFKVWALVDEKEKRTEGRVFLLAMTGADIPWFILDIFGTSIVRETGIVIHAMELEPKTEAHDAREDERFYPQEETPQLAN